MSMPIIMLFVVMAICFIIRMPVFFLHACSFYYIFSACSSGQTGPGIYRYHW